MFSNRIAIRTACALAILFAFGIASAQELTLGETQRLAETAQPSLEAKRSAEEAATESAVAARQLPDPKLIAGITNLPVSGPQAFKLDQDFMTMRMVGVMQEFPRKEKRELRGEILELRGELSGTERELQRRLIRRDAALAWLEIWRQIHVARLIRAKQLETKRQAETLTIALRNARATTADVALARVELETFRNREQETTGLEQAARAMLARWIGVPSAQRDLPDSLPVVDIPPAIGQTEINAIEMHPRLLASSKFVEMAEGEARLARLSTKPDWRIQLMYSQREPAFSDMFSVQFGIDLPLFQANRQDRLVNSRLAMANEAYAQREDMLREMRAELTRLYALWQSDKARVESFRTDVLPQAQLRLDASSVVFRSGKGSLYEVLLARRTLLDLEIETLSREVEAVKKAVMISFLVADGGDIR